MNETSQPNPPAPEPIPAHPAPLLVSPELTMAGAVQFLLQNIVRHGDGEATYRAQKHLDEVTKLLPKPAEKKPLPPVDPSGKPQAK